MTIGDSNRKRAAARRSFLVASAVLLVCLAGIAVYGWFMLRDSEMSSIAVVFLIIGVIVTLGLGIGLMTLLFYSNRQGFDDEVGH